MNAPLKITGFATVEPPQGTKGRGSASGIRRKTAERAAFFLCVLLPTLLVGVYSLFLAANRYATETQFVVRMPSGSSLSDLASLMQGATAIRATDEPYIVNAFITSREAVNLLMGDTDILEILRAGSSDPLWRYPFFGQRHSQESLHAYLQRIISVDYNSSTGISTLTVQAFRPEDAVRIANALLEKSERLLNALNARSQSDAVRLAEAEIANSAKLANEALEKLTRFRESVGFLDPLSYGKSYADTITKLSLEAATARATILELQQTSPQSPQIIAQRIRTTALEQQIEHERNKLAGSDSSLASNIATYERLALEKEFAERRFVSALASGETARLDAARQRVFLERISAPIAPDKPTYPYRLLSILAAFLLFLAIFGVLRTFVLSALEHEE